MALNIVRYMQKNASFWGVQVDSAYFTLKPELQKISNTGDLIQLGLDHICSNIDIDAPIDASAVQWLSPITSNQKIICQGANYRQHMIDSGMDPDAKKFNMFFTKSSASIHAPTGEIIKPKHVQLLDYEIELCLVLKQDISTEINVNAYNLHDYVAGICIGNDISARDVQIPETQFHKGKSYRTFCPLGPVLCLLAPDEMHYLDQLELSLKVNQQIRQQDSTRNMVFKPAETLSEMSQFVNFNAGDVLMTGTPSGCALSIPSPLLVKVSGLLPEQKKWQIFIQKQKSNGRYLCIGDEVESSIQSADGKIDLGRQKHRIA
ncbi:FAA hydrolase family protein [Acinetobacter cumulans]|uniref:FAA hydrolase family protein n=1 Tax=Acinetobacter cumulans TaxID=2136182 RepID=A0ABX9UB06_9GAMM|nr:fumarylacetoacetate hydrolase family protein [Acinetobacter cumulans]RLL49913.1 FAA hydrolase family protein [Acinetobacter cumulans]